MATARKKRAAPKRKRDDGGGPYREATAVAIPKAPPWPWAHAVLAILTAGCTVILYFLAKPVFGDFASWFSVGLVILALALGFRAYQRFTAEPTPPSILDELNLKWFFVETWKRMDEEARKERLARRKAGLGWDYRPLVALVAGAVFLTLMEYFGGSNTFSKLCVWMHGDSVEQTFWGSLVDRSDPHPFARLYGFVWWSGWRVLGYFVMPAVVLWMTRQRVRDQGLETKGFMEHAWIYGFGFCCVFVCVVLVSYTAEFSTYYPFYKLATRSWFDFLVWELLYAAQFLSLEFFFRGYWIKQLKPMMGSYAIFAMVVPYCMIHYGKPFPETMGAIVAGIALGTLAMRTRSIWSGFLIHVSVAVSMDVAALLQTTGMPDRWYPVL